MPHWHRQNTRFLLLLRLTQRSLSVAPHRTLSMASAAGSDQQPGLSDIAGAARCGTGSTGEVGPIGEIIRSLEANKALPNSRWVQLATVRPDGTPAVRTVVFRGFVQEGEEMPLVGSLMFTTDTRSEKCEQLAANDAAELCAPFNRWSLPEARRCSLTLLPIIAAGWLFPDTQEQYRIRGTLRLVTDTLSEESSVAEERALARARRIMWAKMSPGARGSWLWPPPKSLRPVPDEAAELDYKPEMPSDSIPAGRLSHL